MAEDDGDKFRIEVKSAPAGKEREDKVKTHFAEGAWKLERLMLGPELGEYPLSKLEKPVTCQIKARQLFLKP